MSQDVKKVALKDVALDALEASLQDQLVGELGKQELCNRVAALANKLNEVTKHERPDITLLAPAWMTRNYASSTKIVLLPDSSEPEGMSA